MNRVGLGLAMGAGYVLGRTKKMKLAFAIGSLMAGKRLNLGPRAVADLVNQQLRDNPQFKEIGSQLREDLEGVGKAASGAMVERQMNALADRLHGQTAQMRDQLAGVLPDTSAPAADEGENEEPGEPDEETESGRKEVPESKDEPERKDEAGRREEPESKDEEAQGPAQRVVKKAPARTTARNAARTAPARKGAPKKTAARKTAAAGSGSTGQARRPKGGGGR
ncbi:DNA primase [Streptomyces sp. NPDC006012]|uniref:DNA primase n=1 Tax=Streptomyces sp. NPDC006012 TaxID=3364739 RepID=UPI0036990DEA